MKPDQIYQTPDGRYLKIHKVRKSGMHSLITICKDGKPLPNRLNKDGKLIEIHLKDYTEETILTFKKVKL